MTNRENIISISRIISNSIPTDHQTLEPCVDKGSGSGRERGNASRSISYLAKPSRHRPHKLGRPRSHWAKRDAYQRRHCPYRLRRCDVANLIAADRFAARTGRRLATFITLRWFLTRDGEQDIRGRWSALLNAFRIWANRRGFELAHAWVHENPPRDEPTFNSHLLANVPAQHWPALKAWLEKQLGALDGAVDVQPRTSRDWLKPDRRISYLCKGTDRATAMKFRLITEKGWDYNQGIVPFQRSGTSRNINAAAREFSVALTRASGHGPQYAHAREGICKALIEKADQTFPENNSQEQGTAA